MIYYNTFKTQYNLILSISLSIFVVGFLSDISVLRDIGIYISLLVSLCHFFVNYDQAKISLVDFLLANRTFILYYLILLCIMIISSSLAYYSAKTSLHSLIKSNLNLILFLFMLATLSKFDFLKQYLKYAILLSFAIVTIKFLIFSPLLEQFKIDRAYSIYFELLFPFLISYYFFSKTPFQRFLCIIFIIFSILLIFLTGARGAYLAGFLEFLIIYAFYLYFVKESTKIKLKNIVLFICIFGAIFMSAIHLSPTFKESIDRGSNPNGRGMILKTRFPIFIQNGSIFLGLGVGDEQYHHFLNDHQAPQILGMQKPSDPLLFQYFHDEPFFISFFYHNGILGLSCFIILFFYTLRQLVLKLTRNQNDYIDVKIAIFAALIGKFLVRGIFEGLRLEHFLILLMLTIIYNFEERLRA